MAVSRNDLMDTANLCRIRVNSLRMAAQSLMAADRETSDALQVMLGDLEEELTVLSDGLEALEVVS